MSTATGSATDTAADLDQVITFSCAQRRGIVHALTGVLVEHGGDIIELKQFDDPLTDHFFSRIRFSLAAGTDVERVRADVASLGEE